MLKNYFKIAWRHLIKQKATSFINITGLSIAMAASVLIFLWVHNELNFDNYHQNTSSVYRLTSHIGMGKQDPLVWETTPYQLGVKAMEELPAIQRLARVKARIYDPVNVNVKGEYIKEANTAYIDSGWLRMFDYRFVAGNTRDFDNDPTAVLVTESIAKKYFGHTNAVGEKLRIDTVDFVVKAVMEDIPNNSSFRYDMLFPVVSYRINTSNRKNDDEWGNYNYLTFVQLRQGVNVAAAEKQLTDLMNKQRERADLAETLVPLKDLRFETMLGTSMLQHTNKKVVYIFSVLGVVLLLIACINYVNLTTARALQRVKEVSIRKIAGAERKQLLWQFIAESALMSFISLLVALLLIRLALPAFNSFTEKNFELNFEYSGWWLILGGTLLGSILLTSIYPAILLSSFEPLAIFKGRNVMRIKDTWLRKSLVVVQFTVSIFLIVSTIVIYRQLNFINSQRAAYDQSQVFVIDIPYKVFRGKTAEQRQAITNAMHTDLKAETSVRNVSLISQESVVDMRGGSSGDSNDWDGRDKDFKPMIAFFGVDSSFKSILNLQLKEGRWFLNDNAADKHNSILNETAVREFGIQEPVIGKRFTSQGDTGVVIGVVKDFFYKSMHEKIGPVVIRDDQEYNSTFLVQTAAGRTKEATARAETIWQKFIPNLPFEYKFASEEFDILYRDDRRTATLIWMFSAIAILISCLGLLGLAAHTAERRSKEVGIRKVLGASVIQLVNLLSKEFLLLVILAAALATPISWWAMNSWLDNFAYRANMVWWIFLLATALSMLVALCTVGFQALRAAMTNPVRSLRTE